MTCLEVVKFLEAYHHREYPEDGNWEDWYISFSPIQSRDEYVLLIKYRQPPGQGDLFARWSVDGMSLHFYEAAGADVWRNRLRVEFDRMRMEVIETLDGLAAKK